MGRRYARKYIAGRSGYQPAGQNTVEAGCERAGRRLKVAGPGPGVEDHEEHDSRNRQDRQPGLGCIEPALLDQSDLVHRNLDGHASRRFTPGGADQRILRNLHIVEHEGAEVLPRDPDGATATRIRRSRPLPGHATGAEKNANQNDQGPVKITHRAASAGDPLPKASAANVDHRNDEPRIDARSAEELCPDGEGVPADGAGIWRKIIAEAVDEYLRPVLEESIVELNQDGNLVSISVRGALPETGQTAAGAELDSAAGDLRVPYSFGGFITILKARRQGGPRYSTQVVGGACYLRDSRYPRRVATAGTEKNGEEGAENNKPGAALRTSG